MASISISKMFCCITLLFHLCQGATRFNSRLKEPVLLNALAQGVRNSCASWRAFYNWGKIYLGLNLIGHKGQPPPQMTKPPWLLLFLPVVSSQAFHKLKHWNFFFLPTRKAKIKSKVARELIVILKGQGLASRVHPSVYTMQTEDILLWKTAQKWLPSAYF